MTRFTTMTREAALDRLAAVAPHVGSTATEGWAGDLPVMTPWAPMGPSASALPPGRVRTRRRWDDLTGPRGARGYFEVKAAIPTILSDVLGR